MQLIDRYSVWNDALIERFFRPAAADDPVYLAVDDDELADAGRDLRIEGDATDSLSRAVRSQMAGRGTSTFVRLINRWRADTSGPPYVAFLALTVLAASRMASDPEEGIYSNDYYARLNPLIGREAFAGMPPSFDRVKELWKDLASWLDNDLRGARGRSTISGHDHFVNIGWPLSQCVLRASDRARLGDFFRFAGFEPRERVSGQRLLTLFRVWARPGCGLSSAGLHTAATTTLAMQEQLADVLSTELEAWTGELRDARGRSRGEILLFAERSAGGRRVELALYARRPDGFPEGCFESDDGIRLALASGSDGWYTKIPLEVTDRRLAGPLRIAKADCSLSFTPDRVIPMRETFQPSSGWLESRQVVLFEPHMVLAHTSLEAIAQAFLRTYAEPGWTVRLPRGMPAGWLLLDGVRINRVPADVPAELLRLAPRLLAAMNFVGGLQLAPRTYLQRGEPDVQITLDDGQPAVVKLDGTQQRFAAPAVELRLADQQLDPSEHVIEAVGQTRTLTTVYSLGLHQADQAGAMALQLQRHAGYVPAATEAQEVLGPVPRGTVRIAGAHIVASPDDLPLVPAKPVVLRRQFVRWQLLGARVGEVLNGGPTPERPDWLRTIPGHPTCQFFEVHPLFEPQLVVYTGQSQRTVRPLGADLSSPRWPRDASEDDARLWAEVVLKTEHHHSNVDEAAQGVWAKYVDLATEVRGELGPAA